MASTIPRTPYTCPELDCGWSHDWPASIAKHAAEHERRKNPLQPSVALVLPDVPRSESVDQTTLACGFVEVGGHEWRCQVRNVSLHFALHVRWQHCPLCRGASVYAPAAVPEVAPRVVRARKPRASTPPVVEDAKPAASSGLSVNEEAILAALKEGPLTQQGLAIDTGIARRSLWFATTRLIQRGRVKSRPSLTDTRQTVYSLKEPTDANQPE